MLKQQSAMEYLMTYGWAILVIAIALAAMFQLGIFNSSALTPTAPAGSCQVSRPLGPHTTQGLGLVGACNNLQPESVGVFSQNSYINVSNAMDLNLVNAFTISAWVNPMPNYNPFAYGQVFARTTAGGFGYEFGWTENTASCATMYTTNGPITLQSNVNVCSGKWSHVVYTFDGSASTFYINGTAHGSSTGSIKFYSLTTVASGIGRTPARTTFPYNGMIADVQVYNVSLSQNAIASLYKKGIGGSPIDLQYLVGWWPLNGDANDYSGNNANSINNNVLFSSNWQTGYTTP